LAKKVPSKRLKKPVHLRIRFGATSLRKPSEDLEKNPSSKETVWQKNMFQERA